MAKYKIDPDRKYAPYIDTLRSTEILIDEFYRREKWESEHKNETEKISHDEIVNNAGSHYLKFACVVMLASTIESFANSLGAVLFIDWDDKEKKETKEKIKLICEKFNIICDYGKYPFSEFGKINSVRNKIVHAKFEDINKPYYVNDIKSPHIPPSSLEKELKQIDLIKSKNAFLEFKKLILEEKKLNDFVLDEFKDRCLFLQGHTWATTTSRVLTKKDLDNI